MQMSKSIDFYETAISTDDRIENILHSICLAHKMGTLTTKILIDLQVQELLQSSIVGSIDEDLLELALAALIDIPTDESLEIIRSCLYLTGSGREMIISKIGSTLMQICTRKDTGRFVLSIAEICNEILPDSLAVLQVSGYLYSGIGRYCRTILSNCTKDYRSTVW
jgi:hypothetical protein